MATVSILSLSRATAMTLLALCSTAALAACAVDGTGAPGDGAGGEENVARSEERWDSQGGNPTHATHSYLTEYAVDHVGVEFPEVKGFKSFLVDGANQELHELKITTSPEEEALRVEAQGTNWACDRPETMWNHARASYAAGDKQKAYWYVGILLHWVEDMGVPAHAFHVIHQGTYAEKDNFELLGLQRWSPRFDASAVDPQLALPSDYMNYSGAQARKDFNATFPGKTYTTTFFPISWLWTPTKQAQFVQDREGRTATVATWALRSAVTHF